jgi:hypothetical protein
LVHPVRETINPYFDPLSGYTYLVCEVKADKRLSAHYYIDRSNNQNLYFLSVVEKHSKNYELKRKFTAQATECLSGLMTDFSVGTILAKRDLNQDDLDVIVGMKLLDLRNKECDSNHWAVALWEGCRFCPDLLGFLKSRCGPVTRSKSKTHTLEFS